MAIAEFRVPHPRPKKLSDPHYDFTWKLLAELLATPDDQLEMRHYRNLLGPHLPAGTYDESVYFLPGAFQYMLRQDVSGALDLITPIIGFIAYNQKYLHEDGLLDSALDCIRELFAYWTSRFQVICLAPQPGQEQRRAIKYSYYVENQAQIVFTTSELVRFSTNAALAEEFVCDLALNSNDPIKAAWFLAYSCSQYDVYHPPLHPAITRVINDEEHLLKAAIVVEEHVVPKERFPMYWRDVFIKLGMANR
jgi:hypothetical protein